MHIGPQVPQYCNTRGKAAPIKRIVKGKGSMNSRCAEIGWNDRAETNWARRQRGLKHPSKLYELSQLQYCPNANVLRKRISEESLKNRVRQRVTNSLLKPHEGWVSEDGVVSRNLIPKVKGAP